MQQNLIRCFQIIIRARQAHLYANYTRENRQLTVDTLAFTQTAWTAFFFKYLSPSLAALPTDQDWTAAQAGWAEVVEKEKDSTWVELQKARDEKWSLSMGVLRTGYAAIKTAIMDLEAKRDGEAEVQRLLEANKDSLYLLLDTQVSDFEFSTNLAHLRLAARLDRHRSSNLPRPRRVLGRIVL